MSIGAESIREAAQLLSDVTVRLTTYLVQHLDDAAGVCATCDASIVGHLDRTMDGLQATCDRCGTKVEQQIFGMLDEAIMRLIPYGVNPFRLEEQQAGGIFAPPEEEGAGGFPAVGGLAGGVGIGPVPAPQLGVAVPPPLIVAGAPAEMFPGGAETMPVGPPLTVIGAPEPPSSPGPYPPGLGVNTPWTPPAALFVSAQPPPFRQTCWVPPWWPGDWAHKAPQFPYVQGDAKLPWNAHPNSPLFRADEIFGTYIHILITAISQALCCFMSCEMPDLVKDVGTFRAVFQPLEGDELRVQPLDGGPPPDPVDSIAVAPGEGEVL